MVPEPLSQATTSINLELSLLCQPDDTYIANLRAHHLHDDTQVTTNIPVIIDKRDYLQ
jgi:hypothetical protein